MARTEEISWDPPLQYDANGLLVNGPAHLIGGYLDELSTWLLELGNREEMHEKW